MFTTKDTKDTKAGTCWFLTFVSFVSFVVAIVGNAQQSDRERAEALARRATERLQALQHEADRLASEEQTLLGDLRRLEVDREIKAEQFRQADAQLQKVSGELTATTEQMRQLEEQDRAQRPVLRARLVEMYKLGQGRYLRLLLAATDLRQAGQASRTVGVLAEIDRQRIAARQKTLADLGGTHAQLELRRQELAKARGDANRAQLAADRAAQARSELIRDIDRRRDLNAQFAGELQSAQQKLQAELAVLS